MSKCDIDIQFDRPDRTYRGGDRIAGEVTVRVNKDIRCNGIVLSHYWGTHGRGNTDTGTKVEIPLCGSQSLQAGEEMRFPFEFECELWPLTYRGHYINVDHYVHVGVDVPWAIDPKHAEEFIVLPGQVPPQFTGDRSEIVELKANAKPSAEMGFVGKLFLGAIIILVLGALAMLAAVLIPVALVIGLVYWIRRTAVSRRLGEVYFSAPEVIVSSGEEWSCKLEFTPKKTFRINEISARLLVQEAATSGSGTNKSTHRHTLIDEKQIIIPEGALTAGETFSKQLKIALPETEAWSLSTSDNKLEWKMDVRIDIPRYPDWSEKTTLQMVPAKYFRDAGTPVPSTALETVQAGDPAIDSVVDAPAASTIFQFISEITQADRYGNERSTVVSAADGRIFNVALIVDRVSTTLGLSDVVGDEHMQGRTVLGTVAGTDQEVQLFTRPSNNTAVDTIARDEVWESRAAVKKWDSLYNRLVLVEA